MIKFFRKIRRQLLTKNKFTKYLLYAIGEIILVVIGILIAVQINIWNETRKSEERTKQLLINVQKELALNIKYANLIIDVYRGKDSIIYKVLNKKATYSDYKYKWIYLNLITSSFGFSIVDDAFKNFIESPYNLSIEQDSVVIKLKELYGDSKKDVEESEIIAQKPSEDFYNKLKSEKDWFYKFVSLNEITDDMIDYFLNDPSYLNIVSSYELNALINHLPRTLDFRNKAIMIYENISEDLNLKKDTLIAKNIKNYKHYIGTYKADSLYTISIKEEKNNLIGYSIKQQDTIVYWNFNAKIYPNSKIYFTFNIYRFGQLIFDENNEVTGLVLSLGIFRREFKKVD